jgi:malonyl CoA-acyl carrier protein transacylase
VPSTTHATSGGDVAVEDVVDVVSRGAKQEAAQPRDTASRIAVANLGRLAEQGERLGQLVHEQVQGRRPALAPPAVDAADVFICLG